MNDEDFARHAFAAAFRSGHTGEPPALPDVELLAQQGRHASRNRHGLYAAGTTVVAGVAVAGVVTGPSLLGLGSPSPSNIGAAQGVGSTRPPSSPAPSATSSEIKPKPSAGTPCTPMPAIDWVGVVNASLPGGVAATTDHSANCVQTADGSRAFEALFKLSNGAVELQVNVQTGPDIAAKLSAAAATIGIAPVNAPTSESLDPTALANLRASKMAAAASAAGDSSAAADKAGSAASASASLDAAALASLQAQKRALASTQATTSPAPGTAPEGFKPNPDEKCSQVAPDENACVSHLTKGALSVVDVQLLRTGSAPALVDVAASNGKDLTTPASGQLPSDATMKALAQAVAARF